MKEEDKIQLFNLLNELETKEKTDVYKIKELFRFYNLINPTNVEHYTGCGPCNTRILNYLKRWRIQNENV